ncbi:MAG: NfeD family protein [Candidatus Methanoplasma sp.]|jgi:membrane protein implicated in regulation of membrane protease activity|nr:NfeD family protein [Candidatus Methanoplasma sp.]
MDSSLLPAICILIGLVLLIIEATTPGSFIVIPGAVLLAVGLVGQFVDGFMEDPVGLSVVALATAAVVTAATLKIYQLLAKPEPPATTVTESLVGRDGVVTSAVEPGSLRGKVRIGSEIWSATSDFRIEEGAGVTICEGSGVHVKVLPKAGSE